MIDEREGFISASYLESVADCNGKWNAEANIPEPPSSKDAARGTLIHSALAGQAIPLADDELEIFYQLGRKRDALIAQHFPDGVDKEIREQRYRMRDKKIGDYRFSGMPDLVVNSGSKYMVIDYKTGRGEVADSADNLQLRALAVLVAEVHRADVVLVAIVQAFESPQVVAYTKNDLRDARAEVLRILQAAINPDARRNATPAACKYCRARPTCPEAGEKMMEVAEVNTEQISVDDLPLLLDVAKIATDVIKDIRQRAENLLGDDPDAVAGWELRSGNKTRIVNNPKMMRAELVRLGLLTVEDVAGMKFSVTEAEQLIGKKQGVSARAARVVLDRELGNLVKVREGKCRLSKRKG